MCFFIYDILLRVDASKLYISRQNCKIVDAFKVPYTGINKFETFSLRLNK